MRTLRTPTPTDLPIPKHVPATSAAPHPVPPQPRIPHVARQGKVGTFVLPLALRSGGAQRPEQDDALAAKLPEQGAGPATPLPEQGADLAALSPPPAPVLWCAASPHWSRA
ncbi:hypothetical protein KY495_11760 [Massilia sp. PAMC28688]|uniref:hypothetical protein n=1 Tax=Massilia sp. PAMC28688 TaxID=2861283 RepID=UPI001C625F28|nr:hypothetical protein [Massilia sp. PAMC28688]QYF95765.1 hypothetical protein KY495_11760 [Massilia sp. PAMC28688]